MLKQNAVRSQNVKLKCRKFSTLQKCEIKMQQKISVLQYYPFVCMSTRLLKHWVTVSIFQFFPMWKDRPFLSCSNITLKVMLVETYSDVRQSCDQHTRLTTKSCPVFHISLVTYTHTQTTCSPTDR